nr:reverse transcriptase domain-containing protein [Tanacetum cinerariifolium]
RAEHIGYGIRDTWIDPRDVAKEEALTTLEGVNTRLSELAAVQEQNTQDIYGVMEDTQGRQTKIFQRVEALVDDSQYHYETGRLVDQEARCSREAWAHSIGLSSAGVAKALAARDADRNMNSDDSHVSRTGVVELTQWFEKMETVFRISNCSVENQIKFSTCTLLGSALTWWNSHVMTVVPDATYAMTWVDMKKKMTDKYCPRGEMKKLKSKLWNLRVKGNDVGCYNQRFQELELLCVRMFPEEADKIERYVGGLPDVIHVSVVASRPKTMQEEIEMANELMDKRNNSWAERQAEKKRKVDDTFRSNQSQQQQQNMRQNTDRAYTAGLVKRNRTEGLNLYALSETITMMVHVPRNASSATKLAKLLVIVGVQQMSTLLIIRGEMGRVRSLLVTSVDPKDISRRIV